MKIYKPANQQEEVFHQDDLIKLELYGVSIGLDGKNPSLILRDSVGVYTLPVAISPIDAGISMTQASPSATTSGPHTFTQLLLESLNIKTAQCVFVQIKNGVQYVRIYFMGHPNLSSLKIRASEAMSLCAQFKIPIFASKEFINQSKQFHVENANLEQPHALPQLELKSRPHTYIM
jgi:uncharacterized protein